MGIYVQFYSGSRIIAYVLIRYEEDKPMKAMRIRRKLLSYILTALMVVSLMPYSYAITAKADEPEQQLTVDVSDFEDLKAATKQISSISAQTGASGSNINTIVAAKTGDDEYIWLMFAVIVIIMTATGTVVFIKMIRHNKL